MATIRSGSRTALVVVDVQVGVMCAAWEGPAVIARVARLVAQARAAGVPVIWVQHADVDLPRESADWQWVPELVPAAGEARVHKMVPSAFELTTLEPQLAALGVNHLVLVGAQTNWCIRATAYAALERGYDLTLVTDAHTTSTVVHDDGLRVEAEVLVRDLNTTMRWLSYPGRCIRSVDAEALSFQGSAEFS